MFLWAGLGFTLSQMVNLDNWFSGTRLHEERVHNDIKNQDYIKICVVYRMLGRFYTKFKKYFVPGKMLFYLNICGPFLKMFPKIAQN